MPDYHATDQDLIRAARETLDRALCRAARPAPELRPAFSWDRLGGPTEGFEKPRYGTPAYALALQADWIGADEERRDREDFEARRERSLQTCHRYSLYEKPRHRRPPETGAYVPPLSERLEADRNLTDGARRLARVLAGIIYRQNRAGRFAEITVSYLAHALRRSRRTIQRYLRALEREGYIRSDVIRGERSRLCAGLLIALCGPLFPRHHRKEWPRKLRNPGATKESHNYRHPYLKRGKSALLSVRDWSRLCMDGVFRAFMKTDPLGLMETAPLRAA